MTTPKLYTANGNTARKWYIHFWAVNPHTGNRERVRIFRGFAEIKDYADRLQYGQNLVSEISQKLKTGWCPFTDATATAAPGQRQPVADLLLHALANMHRIRRWRPKTIADYTSCVNVFAAWCLRVKVYNIQAVTEQKANDFLNYLLVERGAVTRNKYRAVFRGLWANLGGPNPWLGIKKVKEVRHGKLAYNDQQAAQLKNEMIKSDPWLWLVCAFQYYCFLRPVSEVRLIRVQDIDFSNRKLRISGENVKTGKTKVQDIPGQLFDLLVAMNVNQWPQNFFVFGRGGKPGPVPISKNVLYKRHVKIQRKLGIGKQFSLYSWKHTGNVALYRKFKDIKLNQLINDHTDISTTDIYLRSKGAYDVDKIRNEFPTV